MNVTLRTWFELTRISNLPSVVTSSLVGVFMITPLALDPLLVFGVVLPLLLAIACIYLGGFVLNDVFDLHRRPDQNGSSDGAASGKIWNINHDLMMLLPHWAGTSNHPAFG